VTSIPSSEGSVKTLGKSLEWIGAGSVLILAGIRCLVRFTNEVPWEFRDLASPEVTGGVGPDGTLFLDWMSVIVLCAVLLGNVLQRKDLFLWPLLLWLTGCAFILWHGWQSADAVRIGASWLGAGALGLAALHLSRAPGLRKFLLLGFVALLVPLSAKAFLQVGLEHSQTVLYYEEHKSEILARFGWQEGDAEARRFEGRLLRNDAKGAFTVANVFATVLIALTGLAMGLLAVSFSQWRSNGRAGPGILCALLFGLGIVCLLLTQSRGGIGAFVLAGLVVLISAVGKTRWRWGLAWRITCLIPIGALPIAIWASGSMSEEGRLALDPSLAVRGWHLEAARVIWMEAPFAGVGPGKFQEAYMVHKNPMSPENVTDPHNIFATWMASMGLGGVTWGLLLLWMVWKATCSVGTTRDYAERELEDAKRVPSATFLLIVLALLFLFQYFLQVQELGPQATLAWILGAMGAILVVLLLWPKEMDDRPVLEYGLLASTLALAIHTQMDMSMSDPMAAPLLFSILGMSAGFSQEGGSGRADCSQDVASRLGSGNSEYSNRAGLPIWGICGLGAVLAISLLIGFVIPSFRAGSELRTAAREFTGGRAPSAVKHLERAFQLFPVDPRPLYLMGVIKLQEASFLHNAGKVEDAATLYRETIGLWDKAEELGSRRAFLCRQKAEVASRVFGVVHENRWRETALRYAQKALVLDPYNRYGYIKMAHVAARLGFCEDAKSWYDKALRLDELMTVLPELRFSPEERKRIETQLAELSRGCHS
jgi:hypothetical protein